MTTKTHIIDCNTQPFYFAEGGYEIVEHQKSGKLIWNPDEVELYLCDEQIGRSIKDNSHNKIEGYRLHKLLKDKPVLNACVLEYLLDNPQLIPEEWKREDEKVFFWGTIYRTRDGHLFIRCLYWRPAQEAPDVLWEGEKLYWSSSKEWYSSHYWLELGWSNNHYAVLSRK